MSRYEWRKTGRKIEKTVKRQVAVEKGTTHSKNFNDESQKSVKILQNKSKKPMQSEIQETEQEETWYLTRKNMRDVGEFDETLQGHSEIEWTNVEFELVWQDVIIEVDDWELVFVEDDELKQEEQLPSSQNDDAASKVDDSVYICGCCCGGRNILSFESFEIEEQIWTGSDIKKSEIKD